MLRLMDESMHVRPWDPLRTIETDRLRLRPPEFQDRDGVWSAAHHPANITKGMQWDPPKTKEEPDEFTRTAIDGWEKGDQFTWSIDAKDADEFVGRVAILKRKDKNDRWYIGYWLHPDRHGQGYMAEAAKAAVDAVFEHMGIDSIISSHASWNAASGKVLQKIGMRHMGHDPEGFRKNGERHPEEQYELTREEWLRSLKGAT